MDLSQTPVLAGSVGVSADAGAAWVRASAVAIEVRRLLQKYQRAYQQLNFWVTVPKLFEVSFPGHYLSHLVVKNREVRRDCVKRGRISRSPAL
jgi:hypothetical protein